MFLFFIFLFFILIIFKMVISMLFCYGKLNLGAVTCTKFMHSLRLNDVAFEAELTGCANWEVCD